MLTFGEWQIELKRANSTRFDGYVKFKKIGGTFIKIFEGDFGDGILYHFTADYPLTYEELNAVEHFKVYPNPVIDNLQLRFEGFSNQLQFEIINNLGQIIYQKNIDTSRGDYTETINMKGFTKGVYVIRASGSSKTYQKKVVKH